MEVTLANQTPLPTQQPQQQAPTATTQAGATETLQRLPDQVVTATTSSGESSVREDDTLRGSNREELQGQQPAQSEAFRLDGVKTRFVFDPQKSTVYLETYTSSADGSVADVVRRIPSEELSEYLLSRIRSKQSSSEASALEVFGRTIQNRSL